MSLRASEQRALDRIEETLQGGDPRAPECGAALMGNFV